VPGLESSFTQLPTEAFETMVGSLADGTPLRMRLARYGIVAGQEVGRILATAVAVGAGPLATARQLREVLGVFKWDAERIARTDQIRVFRESSRLAYIQNWDIVRGYEQLAAKDSRTCPVCQALDGTFYKFDRMISSHSNCRCSMRLVLWERFGVTPVLETGAKWFARQAPAAQREALGSGKFELFAAGALRLGDLVDE
jgi:SPP1 gp7 family putative phage head morphogenesis protein